MAVFENKQMRCPIVQQHLQPRSSPRRYGIPPPFVSRPWPRPANDLRIAVACTHENQTEGSCCSPPAPVDPDWCSVGADDLDGNWHRIDKSRRRRRKTSGPGPAFRLTGGTTIATTSRAYMSGHAFSRTTQMSRPGTHHSIRGLAVMFFAPRHKADLLAWTPSAHTLCSQDCPVAQEPLNSGQASVDLSTLARQEPFEVHLAPGGGNNLGGGKPEQADPTCRSNGHRPLQPPLELPPDPVQHGMGRKGPVTPPTTLCRLAVSRLCFYEQLSDNKPTWLKAANELLGKRLGKEGQNIRPVSRWVDLQADREICWWISKNERPPIVAPGKLVGKTAFNTESCQHSAIIQLGELAQRTNPEPLENLCEHGLTQNLHRKVPEPLRRLSIRDDHPFARCKARCEGSVSYPYPAWRHGSRSTGCSGNALYSCNRCTTNLRGQRSLPTEIACGSPDRYGTNSRPGELHLGSETCYCPDNSLEATRVTGWLGTHDDEVGATSLGLATTLSDPNPFGLGGRTSGDYPIGHDNRRWLVGKPGSDKRPVRTPDDEGANRRFHKHQAGRRNWPRLARLAIPRPPTSASSTREPRRP
jgi:hypothetical protein